MFLCLNMLDAFAGDALKDLQKPDQIFPKCLQTFLRVYNCGEWREKTDSGDVYVKHIIFVELLQLRPYASNIITSIKLNLNDSTEIFEGQRRKDLPIDSLNNVYKCVRL